MAVRMVFIRHAHTPGNGGPGYQPVLQGRTDLPLSARGHEEVRLLRERLQGSSGFAAIYSSPLQRARETAAPLTALRLGDLQLCPELQEIHCGSLDGMPLDEVKRRFPDVWAANLRQADEHFRWPGGESYHEFRLRCLETVKVLAARHRGAVAVVTHAGVINQILGSLVGTSPARWEPFRPGHTGLTEIEWTVGGGRVLRFDDRTHLLPAQGAGRGSAPERVRPPEHSKPIPSGVLRTSQPRG